jgi:hypothetical protein
VASTIGEGTGRSCPGQVEVDPPEACCDDEAEDGHGDRDRLPVGLVDADGDSSDRLAEHQDDEQPEAFWEVLEVEGKAG